MMSFLFYAWWDWRFLFLLIGTGTIDYLCGKWIVKSKSKKFFLYLSIFSNLGSLVFFKYSAWLTGLLDSFLQSKGLDSHLYDSLPEFSLILPVGISFYTFNSLSYTIDLYRSKAEEAENWWHFMAFISFFPHLVAGPIIRARDVLSQLKTVKAPGDFKFMNGVKTCLSGFFQKMVLADNLAPFVDQHFNQAASSSDSLSWWVAMIAFSFQIYFDFNGYSTIARGLAKMYGIHFRLNFNHPYFASGFSDFWKRWHISLSTFFKEYVYFSLGGNRKGKWRAELNRWITMILSGIWHGAGFTFLIWGALHSAYLSLENGMGLRNAPLWMKRVTVFILTVLAWVFFRSTDIQMAFDVIGQMFSFGPVNAKEVLISEAFIWLAIAFFFEWTTFRYRGMVFKSSTLQIILYSLMLTAILLFRGPEQSFIYFQF